MAAEWEGKSRGTVLGYRIFIFFIKHLGVAAAYVLLVFVALYFCFFSRKNSKAIYYYLRKRRKYPYLKSVFGIYKSYYKFGQTIIDKAAISSGLKYKFTYEFDGVENLVKVLDEGNGGILISAHVGNFEIAEFFFEDIDKRSQINLVTSDEEHRNIKEYLESVSVKSSIKFIIIKEDLSHIFEIHSALSRNEIICMTGDRYVQDSKLLKAEFLGEEATFPAGPFLIASKMRVPVIFVYVMKETNKHYHLYARTVQVKARDASDLLEKYIKSVTSILERYPFQWFNYFDFWNAFKRS